MDLTSIDHILTTTRSVRRRLDLSRPVEPEIIERCIEIAAQAPTGGNRQEWHFVVVTDPAQRARVAEYYRRSYDLYSAARAMPEAATPEDEPYVAQVKRVRSSSRYLADHMHEVPALILACIEGRVEDAGAMAQAGLYGSILPAAWSLMLALRARGLGSAWTTLHLRYEREVADVLGIPDTVTQAALLPVAYYTGDDFKPATRQPIRERTYWNTWGKQREADQTPEDERNS
jgi:nitroreductase